MRFIFSGCLAVMAACPVWSDPPPSVDAEALAALNKLKATCKLDEKQAGRPIVYINL